MEFNIKSPDLKKNQNIGICGNQSGYELILNQEGVSFERITHFTEINLQKFSIIIVPQKITRNYQEILLNYFRNGGSAIFETEAFADLFHFKSFSKKVSHLISERDSIYSEIGLIDINSKIHFLKNIPSLDKNLHIFSHKIDEGEIIILPFSINELISNQGTIRKKFYFSRKELPSEIVAIVSKNKLRKILSVSLEYLFHRRNLPFVRKWYYPEDFKNLFMFRIDTDFCAEEDALELFDLCNKYKIPATWFVDTKSEDDLAGIYNRMKNQEIALHCFQHYVFDDYESNKKNIELGLELLKKAGIDPVGFAAPFGDWNSNLARVLQDKKFKYSSEFALDHDNFPFYPIIDGKYSDVLQIPIHPISLGRLNRSHFSDQEMFLYFKQVIDQKLKKNEPIIIYHHPAHRKFEIVKRIFDYINSKNLWKPTFSEYAEWRAKRDKIQISYYFDGEKIFIENMPTEQFRLVISYNEEISFCTAGKDILFENLEWEKKISTEIPEDISRTRKKSWRDYLYEYESYKSRKKFKIPIH